MVDHHDCLHKLSGGLAGRLGWPWCRASAPHHLDASGGGSLLPQLRPCPGWCGAALSEISHNPPSQHNPLTVVAILSLAPAEAERAAWRDPGWPRECRLPAACVITRPTTSGFSHVFSARQSSEARLPRLASAFHGPRRVAACRWFAGRHSARAQGLKERIKRHRRLSPNGEPRRHEAACASGGSEAAGRDQASR